MIDKDFERPLLNNLDALYTEEDIDGWNEEIPKPIIDEDGYTVSSGPNIGRTTNPYDRVWDDVPYEPTLEELSADASPEELDNLTYTAFWDGASNYAHRLPRYEKINKSRIQTEQKLVLGIVRLLLKHVYSKHSLPCPEVSVSDRIQNANLYAIGRAPKYDSAKGVSFAGYVKSRLSQRIRGWEQGAEADLHQGDIIRVPVHNVSYYRVRNFKRAVEKRFDRTVESKEIQYFANFTDEEIAEYEKCRHEHFPLHTVTEVKDLVDEDPTVNPEAFAFTRMPKTGLTAVLDMLEEKSKDVVVGRIGLKGEVKTLRQLAKDAGVSRQAANNRYLSAVKKLRATANIIELVQGTFIEERVDENVPAAKESQIRSHPISPPDPEKVKKSAEELLALRDLRTVLLGDEDRQGLVKKMKGKGITQQELAGSLQIHQPYLSSMLKGWNFLTAHFTVQLFQEAIKRLGGMSSLYENAPQFTEELDRISDRFTQLEK